MTPNTLTPQIDRHKNVIADARYDQLRAIVDAASNNVGADWPDGGEVGAYRILICPTQDIAVKTFWEDGFISRHVLFVGIDCLQSSQALSIKAQGVDDVSAMTLLLAHETFHLSQAKRMEQCHVNAGVGESGFAQGVEPGMCDKWLLAARTLAGEYPVRKSMPPSVMQAADLVSELRADVRAINIARKMKDYSVAIELGLSNARAADELADPMAYKISADLASLLAGGLPSEPEAIVPLWDRAFLALANTKHASDVESIIAAGAGNTKFTVAARLKEWLRRGR